MLQAGLEEQKEEQKIIVNAQPMPPAPKAAIKKACEWMEPAEIKNYLPLLLSGKFKRLEHEATTTYIAGYLSRLDILTLSFLNISLYQAWKSLPAETALVPTALVPTAPVPVETFYHYQLLFLQKKYPNRINDLPINQCPLITYHVAAEILSDLYSYDQVWEANFSQFFISSAKKKLIVSDLDNSLQKQMNLLQGALYSNIFQLKQALAVSDLVLRKDKDFATLLLGYSLIAGQIPSVIELFLYYKIKKIAFDFNQIFDLIQPKVQAHNDPRQLYRNSYSGYRRSYRKLLKLLLEQTDQMVDIIQNDPDRWLTIWESLARDWLFHPAQRKRPQCLTNSDLDYLLEPLFNILSALADKNIKKSGEATGIKIAKEAFFCEKFSLKNYKNINIALYSLATSGSLYKNGSQKRDEADIPVLSLRTKLRQLFNEKYEAKPQQPDGDIKHAGEGPERREETKPASRTEIKHSVIDSSTLSQDWIKFTKNINLDLSMLDEKLVNKIKQSIIENRTDNDKPFSNNTTAGTQILCMLAYIQKINKACQEYKKEGYFNSGSMRKRKLQKLTGNLQDKLGKMLAGLKKGKKLKEHSWETIIKACKPHFFELTQFVRDILSGKDYYTLFHQSNENSLDTILRNKLTQFNSSTGLLTNRHELLPVESLLIEKSYEYKLTTLPVRVKMAGSHCMMFTTPASTSRPSDPDQCLAFQAERESFRPSTLYR
jgi:hypothetical protein